MRARLVEELINEYFDADSWDESDELGLRVGGGENKPTQSLRSLIMKIYDLERNEMSDLSQVMEFDDAPHYIARWLGMPEVAKMSKQELRKDKALLDVINDRIEQNNKKLYRRIQKLKNEVFKMYPLLKDIEEREDIYDDGILDTQKVYKEGKYWIIVTPRYYTEANLSKEEVAQLKQFIKDKSK